MALPRQPFFALAEEAPLVVLGGRLHLCDAVESHRNRLWFDGQQYALIPAARLSELEALYGQLFAAELRWYKFNCLKETSGQRVHDIAEMQQVVANERITSFLLADMIPHLRFMRRWQGLPEWLEPRVVEAPVIGKVPELDGWLSEDRSQWRGSGLLAAALGGDVLILDEKVYPLLTAPAKEDDLEAPCDLWIYCRGRSYSPSLSSCRFLCEIEGEFHEVLDQLLRRRAFAELSAYSERLQKRLSALQQYQRISEDGLTYLYRDRHSGIVHFEGSWCVYVEVPEFVLLDHTTGAYYYFGQTRVAVLLHFDWNTGQVDFQVPAQVLTLGYEHPYTGDGSDRTICMGKYDWSWRQGHTLADTIYQYLLDAEACLLRGYNPYNPNTPRRRLEAMPHRQINWETIQHRGLSITNSL